MKNNLFSPNQRKLLTVFVIVVILIHSLITLHYVNLANTYVKGVVNIDVESNRRLASLEEQNANLRQQLEHQQKAIQYAHKQLQKFRVECSNCVYTIFGDEE